MGIPRPVITTRALKRDGVAFEHEELEEEETLGEVGTSRTDLDDEDDTEDEEADAVHGTTETTEAINRKCSNEPSQQTRVTVIETVNTCG